VSELSDDLLDRLDDEQRELLRTCGRLAAARDSHAYLVGGSVRDLLLERDHDDVDIVVEGDGLGLAQDVSRTIGGELTRHHAFRTATVAAPSGLRVDVATARKEEYARAGQLPQVVAGTLDDDLQRRDFTINTIAVALDADDWGRLIDPLGGRDDLAAGRIKVMHPRSFTDDPTRVLRALRFALRFGYTLDDETAGWLREAVTGGYLERVSGDRVRKELRLAFSESPLEAPERLLAEGVLGAIDAGLGAPQEALSYLQELADAYLGAASGFGLEVGEEARWVLVLAACAHGMPQQARWDLVRRLRLSRDERAPLIDAGTPWRKAADALAAAGDEAPDSVIERTLRGLPVGALLVAAAASGRASQTARRVRHFLEDLRGTEPLLGGDDVQALGVAPGPAVGKFLEKLRAARLDGAVETAADERRLVTGWLAGDARE